MPATPPPPDGPVATDALRAAPSGAAAAPEPGDEGSATPDPVLRARHLPAPGVTPARRDPPARGPRLTAPPPGSEARSGDPGAAGNLRACNVPTSWWSGVAPPAPPPPSPSPGPAVGCCWSTRPRSPATSAAATASPPGRSGASRRWASTPHGSRRGTPSTTWSCAARRGAKPPSPSPAARASTRSSPAGATSTPRCSTWPARPVSRCSRATPSGAPSNRPDAWSSTWRASVPCRRATRWAPTACGRRCVASSVAPTATAATGTPSAST